MHSLPGPRATWAALYAPGWLLGQTERGRAAQPALRPQAEAYPDFGADAIDVTEGRDHLPLRGILVRVAVFYRVPAEGLEGAPLRPESGVDRREQVEELSRSCILGTAAPRSCSSALRYFSPVCWQWKHTRSRMGG